MTLVTRDNEWRIYRAKRGYIVHNSKYDFKKAHTHINSLKTANNIILMCKLEKIPHDWNTRLLESIRRVANPTHAEAVSDFIETKKSKNDQRYVMRYMAR